MDIPGESKSLPLSHVVLALAVIAVWGLNFVVIKVALGTLPPLLFATLRFTFVLVPAVFFIKRPDVPWKNLAGYGLLIGAGQFGLLYIAMKSDISSGLASLLLQTQAIFTIGLSMRVNHEKVQAFQWLAVVLAAAGLALVALHSGSAATPLGLVLVQAAALSWAGGNLIAKQTPRANMLAYVVWASIFSVPPLLILSLVFEGPRQIADGLAGAGWMTWASVLYQSVGNTMFGFAAWGWLLARNQAAAITPMALLVPVFGMGAAAWFLSEPLSTWKLEAAALVLAGLALNTLWPLVQARRLRAT